MELKYKLSIVSSIATIAFTGVGFAAWAFTNSVTNDFNPTGKVTAAIEAKDLKVQDGNGNEVTGLYLICDAPTNGGTNLTAGKGIYWSTKVDGSETITSLMLVGSVNEVDHDIADIASYDGKFTSTATTAINGTYVGIPMTSSLDVTITSVNKNTDVTTTFTLPTALYNKVPSNVTEVSALQAEVNSIVLTFNFQFSVIAIH